MAKTLILAIDGDLTSGQVLEGFLGEAYEVHWARSAMDGLEMAWASRPALILLNVELPDSSGFDLQLQLKRDVSLRDVPVIFLLKEMNAELESQALEMGAADCLVKPLHPRLLARKVGNVISREMLRVELARREADWRAILQTVPDLMFRIDRKGTYLSVFAHDASLLALPKRQLIGKSVFDVLPADAAAIIMEALAEAAEAGGSYGRVIELEFPDGVHWFELSVARAGRAQAAEQTFILLSRDVTRRKQAELQIRHLARHDPLTALPNRAHFLELAEMSIAIASRSQECVALLYLDLDKFKPVNDTYGHRMGDRVLKEAAARMQACLRKSDSIGRIGGDEFMILLTSVDGIEAARHVADKLRRKLEEPMQYDGVSVAISCSTGIALYPQHGRSFDELSHCADSAMYAAKQAGRNAVQIYSDAGHDA